VQRLLDQLMQEEGLELDDLTELLMRGEGAEMEMAIRNGGRNVGLERLMYFLQVGYFSRRITDNFDMAAIERDFAEIMRLLEERGLDPGQLARIRNYLELRLGAGRRMGRLSLARDPGRARGGGGRGGGGGGGGGGSPHRGGPPRQADVRAAGGRGQAEEAGGGRAGAEEHGRRGPAPGGGAGRGQGRPPHHPQEPPVRRG